MQQESPLGILSRLSERSLGVFRGSAAVELGVSRKQLTSFIRDGVVVREFRDTYRMTSVARSREQRIRSALLWAGPDAAAACSSAGELFGLQGVSAPRPEIVVPRTVRTRSNGVIVHHSDDRAALMIRKVRGLPATGVEATLVTLAHTLEAAALEIACEDARRRGLTSVPAMHAYLSRFGRPGRRGTATLRNLLDQVDPVHPSRSTLEVKTRRLLVANGMSDFVREFPLAWNGRRYLYDFCFERRRTILETNGRRWHDDPTDYEHDHEKWSVPGRHGYRIVFATWEKVMHGQDLLDELAATLAL